MSDLSVAPDDPRVLTKDPVPIVEQAPRPQVVISERAVMLGTAAVTTHDHHVIAAIRAIFDHSEDAHHHHQYYPPRLDVVLEHAAMEREMHRL